MKWYSKILSGIALFACAALSALPNPAIAQSYALNNPVYVPTPILASQSLAAPGALAFQTNSVGSVSFRVTGTYTGLVAEIDCTTSRDASPTWSAAMSFQGSGVGGQGLFKSITANGLYILGNLNSYSQCRFNVTAISTGSVSMSAAGGYGRWEDVLPLKRRTYRASITGLAPVASATDLFTIYGSATNVVRVKWVKCSGISTANANYLVSLVKRSTADSGGSSTAPTLVPMDSSDSAATAVVAAYTGNPTTGSAVGTIDTGSLITNTLATTSIEPSPLVFNSGADNEEEFTLRSATEGLAINGRGASASAGAALDCTVEFTEG